MIRNSLLTAGAVASILAVFLLVNQELHSSELCTDKDTVCDTSEYNVCFYRCKTVIVENVEGKTTPTVPVLGFHPVAQNGRPLIAYGIFSDSMSDSKPTNREANTVASSRSAGTDATQWARVFVFLPDHTGAYSGWPRMRTFTFIQSTDIMTVDGAFFRDSWPTIDVAQNASLDYCKMYFETQDHFPNHVTVEAFYSGDLLVSPQASLVVGVIDLTDVDGPKSSDVILETLTGTR